ncbi:retrovirus-related Pol polyprotein from transposon 297 [Trichonephila clavipes]|nr:retrovirus-related Pol polyprotein from transposon 297 [Trichonephila clavipes]
MRYCRERLSLTTLETADGTSTTLALKKKYADQTLLAVLRQVPREADPQYVVTDPRRHIADPVSRQAVGARKTKRATFKETDKSTAAKTNVKHRIFTGDHAPINQRAYRVSPTERRIIHEEVQKMLDEGIVQPSESPWSSPIVLVRKRR